MGETLIPLYFSGNLLQYLQFSSFNTCVGEKEEIISDSKPADKVPWVLSFFFWSQSKILGH